MLPIAATLGSTSPSGVIGGLTVRHAVNRRKCLSLNPRLSRQLIHSNLQPIMKGIVVIFSSLIPIFALHAEPIKGVSDSGYIEPHLYFRDLLQHVAKILNKQVVVESEEVLRIETSLVVPGPVSFENIRKVIGALLMLEGYELVEKGDELHLQRILTKKQRDELNKALGRSLPATDPAPMPRQRVSGSADQTPREWVIVRPSEVPGVEKAAPSDGEKPSN